MMKHIAIAATLAVVATPAWAGRELRVVPKEAENQTIRYMTGTPTADLDLPGGAVQITPLPMDHGKLSFSVVYWNRGELPVNFGVESISVRYGDQVVPVLTAEELVKRAKSRAMWKQIGIAMAAGLAAGAVANSTDHYRMTTYGPGGRTYRSYGSITRSNPGAVLAVGAAGGVGIYAVQQRLDETRRMIGESVVQTTTVDPDDSYGGTIVLEKIAKAKWPGQVSIAITLGETTYPFTFDVSR